MHGSRRLVVPLLGLVAVIGVALLASLGGRDDGYVVHLRLVNADGLRNGSDVTVDGRKVGRVRDLELGPRDAVQATLELDDGVRIGPGARVDVKSRNLLGEKFLALDRGDRRRPLASGATIPAGAVTRAVDLDQVLDVLTPETRTRLSIVINELGASFSRRGRDFSSLVASLPGSFEAGRDLLDRVVADNRTLGELIDRSDRFMATFTPRRRELTRLVGTLGQTTTTLASRDAALAASLRRAPATLRRLDALLTDLERAAGPLGPAARAITATAPPLLSTLNQLPAFRDAATPVLRKARTVAPQLTDLCDRATPVLRETSPTLASLATLSDRLGPAARTLDLTAEDLMAVLQGWSRAIQGRDGLTHMFRAKVNVNIDTVRSLVGRLSALLGPQPAGRSARSRGKAKAAPPRSAAPAAPAAPSAPASPGGTSTSSAPPAAPGPAAPPKTGIPLIDDLTTQLRSLLGQ